MNAKAAGKYLIAGAILASALFAYRSFGWNQMAPVNSLGLDLSRPDALILSRSIASLPRDLLSIPLARDVLREDLVFYYENNEDRLGLKGTLRRIAYEHELTWGDELIRMVLDEPAEMALWRDADGRLKHWAVAVTRNRLARLLEEAGKVALKDTQMRLAGELGAGADKAPVYALDYAYGRTLLFVARGDRLVILSHPGMLYGGGEAPQADAGAQQVVSQLLAADPKARAVFRGQFQLGPGIPAGHSVAVKADFLSFGYQPFFGALQALRFDFSKSRWQTQVLLDGASLKKDGYDSRKLWEALPYGASACFILPVDWPATRPVLQRLGAARALTLDTLATQFAGPAAACWYGGSRLYTPVFVAQRAPSNAAGGQDAALAGLFDAMTGASTESEAGRWQRSVQTPEGELTPTLAASGDTVVFSADPALVESVLAVKGKRAAAASDRLPAPGRTIGIINPAALSQLVQKEAMNVLPASTEPVLRGAAETHLLPRLTALSGYPAYRMVLGTLPASGPAWTKLEWQAIR
jgi:uncharacterized protein YfaA (DUF2138 family)